MLCDASGADGSRTAYVAAPRNATAGVDGRVAQRDPTWACGGRERHEQDAAALIGDGGATIARAAGTDAAVATLTRHAANRNRQRRAVGRDRAAELRRAARREVDRILQATLAGRQEQLREAVRAGRHLSLQQGGRREERCNVE